MSMPWFFPLAVLVGVTGTRTSLTSVRVNKKDRSWWVLLAMAWWPLLCWVLSQFLGEA